MARVLVIDDEPDILLMLRMSFEDEGHEVVMAADGRMGLERLAEQKPDVVVLDMMMPVVDGWGVLDEAVRPRPAPRARHRRGVRGRGCARRAPPPRARVPARAVALRAGGALELGHREQRPQGQSLGGERLGPAGFSVDDAQHGLDRGTERAQLGA
jgi:CheY-like chemotaxis protein